MSSFTGRLVGFEPVVAKAGVGNEGNSHLESILHLFEDNAFYLFFLFWEDGEVEFVVYLENHLAPDALGLKTIKDMDHSYLDDVGCCALNRGVDGVTLSKTTHDAVGSDTLGLAPVSFTFSDSYHLPDA